MTAAQQAAGTGWRAGSKRQPEATPGTAHGPAPLARWPARAGQLEAVSWGLGTQETPRRGAQIYVAPKVPRISRPALLWQKGQGGPEGRPGHAGGGTVKNRPAEATTGDRHVAVSRWRGPIYRASRRSGLHVEARTHLLYQKVKKSMISYTKVKQLWAGAGPGLPGSVPRPKQRPPNGGRHGRPRPRWEAGKEALQRLLTRRVPPSWGELVNYAPRCPLGA